MCFITAYLCGRSSGIVILVDAFWISVTRSAMLLSLKTSRATSCIVFDSSQAYTCRAPADTANKLQQNYYYKIKILSTYYNSANVYVISMPRDNAFIYQHRWILYQFSVRPIKKLKFCLAIFSIKVCASEFFLILLLHSII